MTQMIPEALPVRVDVTPALVVSVTGPGGLAATVVIPDTDDSFDALSTFASSLPEAIAEGVKVAEAAILDEEADRG